MRLQNHVFCAVGVERIDANIELGPMVMPRKRVQSILESALPLRPAHTPAYLAPSYVCHSWGWPLLQQCAAGLASLAIMPVHQAQMDQANAEL